MTQHRTPGLMKGLTLVTAPAVEPFTLAEAKLHLRVDDVSDNALIAALILAARVAAEELTRRAFITQTLRLTLDDFPSKPLPWWDGVREGADLPTKLDFVEIPRPPLQSVSSVKAYADDDAATTMATTDYFVDTASEPGRVVLRSGKTWPVVERVANGVEIDFVAGYGGAGSDVPDPIRQAMLLHMAAMYEGRGDDPGAIAMPAAAAALLGPYRVLKL